jgi:DNA (cytosine-5)-methyltransferase 1
VEERPHRRQVPLPVRLPPRRPCGTAVEPGYLPAAAAIDWTLPGKRIGDRTKPLADKTRARIAAGIARYWGPFHIEAGGNQYDAADPKHPQHGDPNAYYRTWARRRGH